MPSAFHRQLADLSYDLATLTQEGPQQSTLQEMGQRVEAFLLRHQNEIKIIDRLALKNLSAQLRLLGLDSNSRVYQIIENLHQKVGNAPSGTSRRHSSESLPGELAFDASRLNLDGGSDITDEALTILARWPDWANIEKLNLHLCTEITDLGLVAIAQSSQLTSLTELNISGCLLITDHGIAELVQGKREWRSLDLSNLIQITDASLGFISHSQSCRVLKRLRLFGVKTISDQGLYSLSVSPILGSLEQLDLGGGLFQLSELGIGHLAGLQSLQMLSLSGCSGVTDKSLAKLATLPNLKQLDLSDCPGVSLEGLMAVAHLELIGP